MNMKIFFATFVLVLGVLFLSAGVFAASLAPVTTVVNPLAQYETNYNDFQRAEIGNLIVYWQQQTVSNDKYTAIVEKAQKVYQFDKDGRLVKKIDTFNYALPVTLPDVIPQESAEALVQGGIIYSGLYYISENSEVFPVKTTNPIWLVDAKIIDAVTGAILGDAVTPPGSGYALTGPITANGSNCFNQWTEWYLSAETGFENLKYPTDTGVWPAKSTIQSYVQNNDVKLFYEIAHGVYLQFSPICTGWIIPPVYSVDIQNWISGYNKKDFTFIASCDGMCQTDTNTLSYAFRKGSTTDTATVGYCDMSNTGAPCKSACWDAGYTVPWQNALFGYMNNGYTVHNAFHQAHEDYPSCWNGGETTACIRFAGDEAFTVDFGAGHLCTADADCESAYCEGSASNAARCCTAQPPNDGWNGGGNTSGCGNDASSNYRDYYCDGSGAAQYETTNTFDCDTQDDCGSSCPALNERTDYYVVPNTNTCTYNLFDADNSQSNCTSCMGNNYWNLGGDIGQCCSDDTGENVKTRVCAAGACTSSPTDDACCNLTSKCVYNSVCYANNYQGDVDADSADEKCVNGTWNAVAVDNKIPILLTPNNGITFYLGNTIYFKWQKGSYPTNPSNYWLRLYQNGVLYNEYGAGPNGFDMDTSTTYDVPSDIIEFAIDDGVIEWQVGAAFTGDPAIHWSSKRTINKHTAAVLNQPADNAKLNAPPLSTTFSWYSVTNAKGYVLKLSGGNVIGWKNCTYTPCYLPLGSTLSFSLNSAIYGMLESGKNYSWSIAGTRLNISGPEDWTLPLLAYGTPRTFHK